MKYIGSIIMPSNLQNTMVDKGGINWLCEIEEKKQLRLVNILIVFTWLVFV